MIFRLLELSSCEHALSFKKDGPEDHLGIIRVTTPTISLEHAEKSKDIKDKQSKQYKFQMLKTSTKILIFALAISVVINIVLISIDIHFSDKEDKGVRYFCSDNWIGFQDKCYYFSEDEQDWNSSRYNCLSQNANLVLITTTKEKHFLKRFKCTSDHWIWRDMTENLTGQWVDENIFNKGINMTGNEICFYLNEDGVATARCYTERKWICRKKVP
ncbi:unnamed protein product [Rangifer tarandus platyrhynchus]|uniref:Uncharacterized protein n=2 Tax=Rangifer tarandus platyrhynchus TaxID=3082113 RepID=A0AC59Z7V4_RANTA